MRSGELNRQITIKRRASASADDAGQPNAPWAALCAPRARYRAPSSGLVAAERVAGNAEISTGQCVWRIRWRTGIDAGMRVEESIGGITSTWDIKQVLPDRARREWIDLVCETGASQG